MYKVLAIVLLSCTLAAARSSGTAKVAAAPQFVVTDYKLPSAPVHHSAVYDGDDSIYILGGDRYGHIGDTPKDSVIKYSVSTGRMDYVGRFANVILGKAVLHGEDILYFGGIDPTNLERTSNIYAYSTRLNTYRVIGNLPSPVSQHTLAWDANNKMAYTFGGARTDGAWDGITKFNATSNESEQVFTRLPTGRWNGNAVWSTSNRVAYIFGGIEGPTGEAAETILRLDPATGVLTKLPTDMRRSMSLACAVYANGQAYIFDQVLIVFDPSTEQSELLSSTRWPQLSESACAYVPKQNRIYFFGGTGSYGDEWNARTEISYFDLGTMGQSE